MNEMVSATSSPLPRVDRSLIGQAFVWSTGLAGQLLGYTEDVSIKGGDESKRAVMLFRSGTYISATRSLNWKDSTFCCPYRMFVQAEIRPYSELKITGSNTPLVIYGPVPLDSPEPYAITTSHLALEQ